MTVEQAIENITAVLEQFRGTKQEHIILEQSLKTLKDELSKDK